VAAVVVVVVAVGLVSVSAGESGGEPAGVRSGEVEGLPRVLLIGDSICGGYWRKVRDRLAGQAVVVKQPGNAQHTWNGLEKLDGWLGEERWDVIHFNWGLWDLAYRNPASTNFGRLDKVNGRLTTSLEDYEKNLRALVGRLEQTGATLIWATTTPVPEGEPGRFKEDAVRYDAVAAKIMAERGIAIDDLYAEMIRNGRPRKNDVHDTGDLSGKVAASILAALEQRERTVGADGKAAVQGRSVEQMQAEFLKLRFGMFIHFNMATFKGVQWVAGYPSAADFDPGGPVDTDAWADAAVSAGMRYAVLTAKHVGGFCLWDSQYTTYDVMGPDCPYQRDLVAQFIRSFTSRGLKVGLYYCWRHPGFDKGKNKGRFKVLPPECDPATHSVEEQIAFQKAQIAELLERYPEVFYVWNDGLDPVIMPSAEAKAFFRGMPRPVLASANWWDWGKKGTPYLDIAVKEMRQFPAENAYPGETCWCLERAWFWSQGTRPKSAEQVVELLRTVNGRRSTLLLNVGPDTRGRFEEASVKVLAEVGRLLKVEGQAGPSW